MIEQDQNARFEKAIFKLLLNFNYIELNVGLLISYIPDKISRQGIFKKLSNKTFNDKMKWFDSLLKEGPLQVHIGEKGVAEFKGWLAQAQETRKLRNRYVHAIWNFYPLRTGSPVSISSPDWMTSILGDQLEESMSLDDLESKASMVENVFKDFCKLRKKYKV